MTTWGVDGYDDDHAVQAFTGFMGATLKAVGALLLVGIPGLVLWALVLWGLTSL